MTLARMQDLLTRAADEGRGLVAMNVIQLEHAEAIISGAETTGTPVIVQISQNAVVYRGTPAPLILATLQLARESAAEVCVHLDHATDVDLVHKAVELGVPSVMFDASTLEHAENVAATTEVVAWCHARGVAVEAELGEIGGKDGVHAPGVRTDPQGAAEYAAATGVDSLAVAVGSSHAMTTRAASLDEPLIEEIAARVAVPLVLHGSSGVPDDGLVRAIAAGMTKINIGTHLNVVFTGAARAALADDAVTDPRDYLGAARRALETEVARLLTVLGGTPR